VEIQASDIAHVMMTIIPVDVNIVGRIAGPIERSRDSTNFFLEMTDDEYTKLDSNRIIRRSPLMR